MFDNDHSAEDGAIKHYNAGIVICGEAKDFATREILETFFKKKTAISTRSKPLRMRSNRWASQVYLSTQLG